MRLTILIVAVVWLITGPLLAYTAYSELGTFLPAPTEAHDLDDLLVWGALMLWTYAVPIALLLSWTLSNRRKARTNA